MNICPSRNQRSHLQKACTNRILAIKTKLKAGNIKVACSHFHCVLNFGCLMKRIKILFTVFSLLLLTASIVHAQAGKLPPFKMMQTSGKVFKAQDLPPGKPIMIVYFSPECDHCQKLLKEFFKQVANFQKASVAFITYLPVDK